MPFVDKEYESVTVEGSSNAYFQDQTGTALTTDFVEQSFGFNSVGLLIANDEAAEGDYIEFSFDGTNVHGRVLAQEVRTMDFKKASSIYLRGESGGESYRVEAY